ncbi:hypothetical protein SAMN05421595_0304 [Austwickia chelonae]|uniref:Uncharacterized protein n=1 Tax=Austwickia chelonae NBRC 105200 TaxID=1184607 RepID=K6VQZ6_9MICO|nr:hypothetical protein [Austwickia chelonae]GAB77795.1 hypothetical protein AUCHE_08_00360 [Austwickia chelonae NBRC 105200]SEV89660.1 hypothetical protein SAMN05421595_0304 [Austwickia chelonae]
MRRIRSALPALVLAATVALVTTGATGASAHADPVNQPTPTPERPPGQAFYRALIFQTSTQQGDYAGTDLNEQGQLIAGQEAHNGENFIGDAQGRMIWLNREATGCEERLWPDVGRALTIDARSQVVGLGSCTTAYPRAGTWAISRWSSPTAAPVVTQGEPVMSGSITVVAANTAGAVLTRFEHAMLVPSARTTERGGVRLVDGQGRFWTVIGNDLAEDGSVVGRLVVEDLPERSVPFVTRGDVALPLKVPAGIQSPSWEAAADAISPNGNWIVGQVGLQPIRWDARRVPQVLPSGFVPVDVNDVGAVLGRLGEGWGVWSPWAGLRTVTIPGLPAGVRVKAMAKINRSGQIAATVTGADRVNRAALLGVGR